MDLGVRNRAYLLTGGSAGLGYATAKELVTEGAHVVITGLTPSDTARAAESLAVLIARSAQQATTLIR